MKSNKLPQPKITLTQELYSINEVAEILGMSRSGVQKWIYDGTLPVIRIRARSAHRKSVVRIARNTLEALIAQGVEDW